jgi:hypothetical protein
MQPKQIRAKLMQALGCEPGSLGEPSQIEAAQGGASRLTTQQGGCNHGRHHRVAHATAKQIVASKARKEWRLRWSENIRVPEVQEIVALAIQHQQQRNQRINDATSTHASSTTHRIINNAPTTQKHIQPYDNIHKRNTESKHKNKTCRQTIAT